MKLRLLALLVVALAACTRPKPPLRVGAILPLTGPDKEIGQGMLESMQVAVDAVNGKGGVQGRKVELVPADDGSTAAMGEQAAKKLAGDESVVAAIGHFGIDAYVAAQGPLGERAVPDVVAGVGTRELSVIGRNSAEVSVLPMGTTQMRAAARYAWETAGARTFAFVRDDTALGRWEVNQFRDGLFPLTKKLATGEIIAKAGDPSYARAIAQLHAAPPDFVFYGGEPRGAGRFLEALRAEGVKSAFMLGAHTPAQELIDEAQADAEGAVAVFPGLPADSTDGGRAFLAAYAAHGAKASPSPFGLFAYAGMQALLEAMERSFLSRPSIAGALGREVVPTVLGPLKFHYVGSTYGTIALYKVVHGAWTPVFTADPKGALVPVAAR